MLMHMNLLGYIVKMERLNSFSRDGLPIQLIQKMHERVCSCEVWDAAPNAVGSDAIYDGFRTLQNVTNILADSSRLRSMNSGLNLSPVMYSVN
jgi:hypothetical protein